MLRFTSTERSEKLLHYEGFQYTMKHERKTVVDRRCRSRICSSTLSLSRDNTVIARPPSGHVPTCSSEASKLVHILGCHGKMSFILNKTACHADI